MALFLESGLPTFVGERLTVFGTRPAAHRPPRLLVRSLLVTFATVLTILLAVFILLVMEFRGRVQTEVADNLETGRDLLADLQQGRLGEAEARLSALGANPTLEAALQKYANTYSGFTPLEVRQSMLWLEGELQKIGDAVGADLVAALDTRGATMAAGGRLAADWPRRPLLALPHDTASFHEDVITIGSWCYRVTNFPLRLRGGRVGTVCVARRFDSRFASDISTITRADTLILQGRALLATTLSLDVARALAASTFGLRERGEVETAAEKYALQRLETVQGTSTYAVASVSTPASRTTARAARTLLLAGLAALSLAIAGSFFLARTLAGPIDAMSRSLSAAVRTRDFGVRLEADRSSREIEVLSETFNELMASLSRAEDERRGAYLEAIRALAKALEARDGYTAGHSERVGDLSVKIAQRLGMAQPEIEALRLGASLHDIGKIGVGDGVLRKNGPLSDAERLAIQAHPVLGARILQPVAFLADHLSIVELHHEQPDGRGYPYGLTGDRIPLSARIVHLADAYDAMTSDRPYRAGRAASDAIQEIIANRGTQFDEAVVDAFLQVVLEEAQTPNGDEVWRPKEKMWGGALTPPSTLIG